MAKITTVKTILTTNKDSFTLWQKNHAKLVGFKEQKKYFVLLKPASL
jgi:hypothetical protein